MKICVLGTGYVGLVVGVCISDRGFDVCCVDTDHAKIEGLKEGRIPIYEPGLDEILERNVKAGRLSFSVDGDRAIAEADIVYIAVGTPGAEDGSADLTWVLAAAQQIAENAKGDTMVIIKSTVPVGTSDRVLARIREFDSPVFDVVSNPEFLREGAAIEDFDQPDRIVVGYREERSKEWISTLYQSFSNDGHPIYFMDNRSAELTKYAANAMLATKISFINELSKLCELVNADVESVREGMGSDSRIGPKFLYPGVGYGGSCFPKDVKALISTASQVGLNLQIANAVEDVNKDQKAFIYEKLVKRFGEENLDGMHFAVWGLAFKPETDDIREAPALTIIDRLLRRGATVRAHDPEAMANVKKYYPHFKGLSFVDDPMDALDNADALLLITEWQQFRNPDWSAIQKRLKHPIVYDGRNIYEPSQVQAQGFEYYGIGRRKT
ncbi:MAG: UDP-glucose/GDP-mannose dehydrogenase family protein [Myxococcota bacterium]|nr:UDP-glucose/GDP-mannose dehydrogenase family protein [Myxococcota bacterium]